MRQVKIIEVSHTEDLELLTNKSLEELSKDHTIISCEHFKFQRPRGAHYKPLQTIGMMIHYTKKTK